MKFKQISWKRRLPKNVLSDSTIEFVVYKSSKDYPATLRRVVYLDEEQGREFMFLTNNFELPASVIAELYHNRWNIELFFKWLKQHLKIKKFWGTSENAVRIQIYCAVITYCLIICVKHNMKLERSVYEILQIVGISLTDKTNLKELFDKEGDEIACVIVEAVAGNMNMVPATQEFLETMREETAKHGTVLIVDEVMTGFRVALGGAQSLYHIDPDITMFGKVIGGGMPVAAFGGKRDIMNSVAPLGPVYQAGTLSGNPVAVTCGLATLHEIQQPGFYKRLSEQTAKLVKGLGAMAKKHGVAFSAQSIGGMFGIYFRGKCPTSFKEVMECDADRFKTFFHAMLDNGVYLAPSIYEAGFVSITHDDSVIARTLEAADEAFAKVKRVHG